MGHRNRLSRHDESMSTGQSRRQSHWHDSEWTHVVCQCESACETNRTTRTGGDLLTSLTPDSYIGSANQPQHVVFKDILKSSKPIDSDTTSACLEHLLLSMLKLETSVDSVSRRVTSGGSQWRSSMWNSILVLHGGRPGRSLYMCPLDPSQPLLSIFLQKLEF